MADDRGNKGRYIPKAQREQGKQRERAPETLPAEDSAEELEDFPTPQMGTGKYREKRPPAFQNERLLILIAAFLILFFVVGLIVRLAGSRPKQATPPPQEPTEAPTMLVVQQPTSEPISEPTQEPTPSPEPSPFPLLKEGSEGEDVARLQERLIELGYLKGEADGKYGRATNLAVQVFQKAAKLDVDGIAGEKTSEALFAENAPHAPAEPAATGEGTAAPAQTEEPGTSEAADPQETAGAGTEITAAP